MLKFGDTIVCYVNDIDGLTYGKRYIVEYTRSIPNDICIIDDDGYKWWFGQIGQSEPWTMWFVTERDWERNDKINQLINIP